MKRITLVLIMILVSLGCSAEEGVGPGGDLLPIDFLNFSSQDVRMGVTGQLVDVPAGTNLANPVRYDVSNPGLGNSITFNVEQGSQSSSKTCTVTEDTNFEGAPQLVVQADGSVTCNNWVLGT